MDQLAPGSRNTSLDVLRGLAVLLVICHHYANVDSSFLHLGGIGVDLFFVLSGFLISGLLFSELHRSGRISLSRFFIRRGLKIYPAFYAFLLLTYPMTRQLSASRFLAEGLFLQSYVGHIWQHTWSLSVEETFYLVLPLLLVGLVKIRKVSLVPAISLALALACFTLRRDFDQALLRCDALFAGVALGYCRHFHTTAFCRVSRAKWLPPLSAVLFLPWIAATNAGVRTCIGPIVVTCNFVGFACVVWWSQRIPLKSRVLSAIGRHSYSIYLWHMPVAMLWWMILPMNPFGFAADIVSAIAVGMAMSLLIEGPVLRLRDKFFPSKRHYEVPSTQAPPKLTAPRRPGRSRIRIALGT